MRLDGRLDSLQINPHAMYDLTAAELAAACTAAAHATWHARADTLAAGLEALGETRPGDGPDPDADLLRFNR